MRARPIGDILTALADADPAHPAVTCEDVTITRAELESRANRLARAYAGLGVRQGDLVTMALPNGIEAVEALFAIWKLGAVPQPVPSQITTPELCRLVELARPSLLVGVGDQGFAGHARVPAGFVPDGGLSDAPLPSRVSPSWKAMTSGGSTGRPKLIVSGVTGEPDVAGLASLFLVRPHQVQVVPGPLFHNAPMTVAMLGLYLGQHVVLLPGFSPAATLAAITRYRANFVNLVPTMMSRMAHRWDETPGAFDLGTLEVVWHMGASCPAWLKERWLDLVGPDVLHELYGTTESQAYVAIGGREWLAHRGSVGRPILGEVKVVDAEGRDAAPGELGEVAMRRGPDSPPPYRYLGATARVLEGGWEVFGDMGHLDAEGYLYLADRQQDMLLVGGANVFPAEVEGAILEHPLVVACVVVGLPDDDLGQRVHAVIQARGEIDERELIAFLSERLLRYKLPRSIRIVDEPLRNDMGKVRRAAVRDREAALAAEQKGVHHDGH